MNVKQLRSSSPIINAAKNMRKCVSPPSKETESVIMSGNLEGPRNDFKYVEMLSEYDDEQVHDDLSDCDLEICTEEDFSEALESQEIEEADLLLEKSMKVKGFFRKLVRLLISGEMSPVSLALQGLIYNVQCMIRGRKSLRFLSSWGMFWAGVRNLVKNSGLVPFLEHFCIPTRLSKFKDLIIETCGLRKSTLGKAGFHRENVKLFISRKKEEIKEKPLLVSLSIDSKKIQVVENSSGRENMGGIDNHYVPEKTDRLHDEEKSHLCDLLDKNERQDLYELYNKMSEVNLEVVKNIHGIKNLIEVNSKKLDRNPRLAKYIYILNHKFEFGIKLLANVDNIQVHLISLVAEKRHCLHLTISDIRSRLDLSKQSNFVAHRVMSLEEDEANCKALKDSSLKHSRKVDEVEHVLTRPLENMPRDSQSFKILISQAFIHAEDVFQATGFSKQRPLQDMKQFYEKVNSPINEGEVSDIRTQHTALVTFCAYFSPLTFGSNLVVFEGGIFTYRETVLTPDAIIRDKDDNVMYTVIIRHTDDSFLLDDSAIVTSIFTSKGCYASKGCLFVIFSDYYYYVYCIPNSNELVTKILDFIIEYSTAPVCLQRRSKLMCEKIESMRTEVLEIKKTAQRLGSYPIAKSDDLVLLTRCNLQLKIIEVLDDYYSYTSKYAKELIAVNINEVSGADSEHPHTILAGAFLTSRTLKVMAYDILEEISKALYEDDVMVLNYGVDGECLHLATHLPDGTPGTIFSLAKHIMSKLQELSKNELASVCAENPDIRIFPDEKVVADDVVEECNITQEIELDISNNIASIENTMNASKDLYTLEDLEYWLKRRDPNFNDQSRLKACKSMSKESLKFACLRYVLPIVRRVWTRVVMGVEKIPHSAKFQRCPLYS